MELDPDTSLARSRSNATLVASVSTRLMPFAWGTAYLNDGYRDRWDSNFLWVDGADGAMPTPDALAAEADRVLGEAGLPHREIRIDDDAYGRSVAAGPRACRLRRGPARRDGAPTDPADRPVSALEAEEVDLADAPSGARDRPAREPWATIETRSCGSSPTSGVSSIGMPGARFFCARVDEEIAAMCELYVRGSIAQIEDVNTLEEFRNRGLGARGGAARGRRARIAGGADGVPARARRRLAEGAVREARVRSDRLRLVVRAAVDRVAA